jgi:hypothetical protein
LLFTAFQIWGKEVTLCNKGKDFTKSSKPCICNNKSTFGIVIILCQCGYFFGHGIKIPCYHSIKDNGTEGKFLSKFNGKILKIGLFVFLQ